MRLKASVGALLLATTNIAHADVAMVLDTAGKAIILNTTTRTVAGRVLHLQGDAVGDCAVSADGQTGYATSWLQSVTQAPLYEISIPQRTARNLVTVPKSLDISLTPNRSYGILTGDRSGVVPTTVVTLAFGQIANTQVVGFSFNDACDNGTTVMMGWNEGVVAKYSINASGQLTQQGSADITDFDTWNGTCASGSQYFLAAGGTNDGNGIFSVRTQDLVVASVRSMSPAPTSAVFDPFNSSVLYVKGIGAASAWSFNPSNGQLGSAPLWTFPLASSTSRPIGIDEIAVATDTGDVIVSDGTVIRFLRASDGVQLKAISTGAQDLTGVCTQPG